MRKKQVMLLAVLCIFTMLAAAPASAWIFGDKPNDDIKLVIKVAKGEADPELRDKIIVKGMNYIKEFVDLKEMVKAAYYMKTKYIIADKKFSKIKSAKELCKIAGYVRNGNTTAKRYREKLIKKGLDHIRIYEELKDVMKEAEYNTTRNYLATEKFIKVKDADQLITIAGLLRNEYYNDGSMKAAYKDKYLLNGAKTSRIGKNKADIIKIAGAADTDLYKHKILKVKPGSSSGSGSSGGSNGGGDTYEPAPVPDPGYPGEGSEPVPGGDDSFYRTKSMSYGNVSEKCSLCNGTGKFGLKTCPACHGAGWSGPMKGNGCSGGSCPMPGHGGGDEPDGKSAYNDPFIEEALKARILKNTEDTEARALLLEIFRKRN
jgi:hypothetical protein